MTATVHERQSVFDIAVQYLGSPEGCFTVAEKLGVSVTGTLTPGIQFDYDVTDVVDKKTAEYYSNNNIIPTTDNDSTGL